MDPNSVDRDIRKFLADNFFFGRADKLSESESNLGNVVDSTGVLELVAFIQSHFGIELADEDIVPENLASVSSVVACVTEKLSSKA